MSTHAIALDEDTKRVARPAAGASAAPPAARARLDQMDLDPPDGPVPAAVLAYFELAVAREAARGRRRDR
jgi:hypothetical protein